MKSPWAPVVMIVLVVFSAPDAYCAKRKKNIDVTVKGSASANDFFCTPYSLIGGDGGLVMGAGANYSTDRYCVGNYGEGRDAKRDICRSFSGPTESPYRTGERSGSSFASQIPLKDGEAAGFYARYMMRDQKHGNCNIMVSCARAGTLIRMADGSKKPIEDLQEGDKIPAPSARYRKLVMEQGPKTPFFFHNSVRWLENPDYVEARAIGRAPLKASQSGIFHAIEKIPVGTPLCPEIDIPGYEGGAAP